jgi:polysaccharide deacetylase family protein (PEP-CTERM system associated)
MNALPSFFTVDVEEWFHILDAPCTPSLNTWAQLESRFERSLRLILEIFHAYEQKATFFWLAWLAERHPDLVRTCQDLGHEIASHGYAHVLAYEVGQKEFREDIRKSKGILEDIIGAPVHGFRAAGFSTLNETRWTFDEVAAAGYSYDSSVFPASRGHGGMSLSPLVPHVIKTDAGPLVEFPQSVVSVAGRRFSLFGGGYLRIAPLALIRWGCRRLARDSRPLIVYLHPREVDPGHPRLRLPPLRYLKCYLNLKSTEGKLRWLSSHYQSNTMANAVEKVRSSFSMCAVEG